MGTESHLSVSNPYVMWLEKLHSLLVLVIVTAVTTSRAQVYTSSTPNFSTIYGLGKFETKFADKKILAPDANIFNLLRITYIRPTRNCPVRISVFKKNTFGANVTGECT